MIEADCSKQVEMGKGKSCIEQREFRSPERSSSRKEGSQKKDHSRLELSAAGAVAVDISKKIGGP